MRLFLANPRQFVKLSIDPNKELNFIPSCEQKFIGIAKEIKSTNRIHEISIINYSRLVFNLESFMVLQKSMKKLLMTSLLFDQFLQPLGHPHIR